MVKTLYEVKYKIIAAFDEQVKTDDPELATFKIHMQTLTNYTEDANEQFNNLYKLTDLNKPNNKQLLENRIIQEIITGCWLSIEKIDEVAEIYATYGVNLVNAVNIVETALNEKLPLKTYDIMFDTIYRIMLNALHPLFKDLSLIEVLHKIFSPEDVTGDFIIAFADAYSILRGICLKTKLDDEDDGDVCVQ